MKVWPLSSASDGNRTHVSTLARSHNNRYTTPACAFDAGNLKADWCQLLNSRSCRLFKLFQHPFIVLWEVIRNALISKERPCTWWSLQDLNLWPSLRQAMLVPAELRDHKVLVEKGPYLKFRRLKIRTKLVIFGDISTFSRILPLQKLWYHQ